MNILWFGRSCVRLQSSQAVVLTDPFDEPAPAALEGVDIITVSDRSLRDRVPDVAGARIVDGPGEYEIKGVPLTGIAVPASAGGDGAARRTYIYSVSLDGINVCHLGRPREVPEAAKTQDIGLPDVLLIPLGEPDGLAPARAVQLASQLEAKLLIPMPMGGPGDAAALETFCKELGADPTQVEDQVTVTASGVAAQTRVAVLARQVATGVPT